MSMLTIPNPLVAASQIIPKNHAGNTAGEMGSAAPQGSSRGGSFVNYTRAANFNPALTSNQMRPMPRG